MIEIYKPLAGTLAKFQETLPNETKDIAQTFWKDLDNACLFFVILCAISSIGFCIYYFTIYNNKPGRHYKISHWAAFWLISIIATLILTGVIGLLMTNHGIQGSVMLIWKVAFLNAVYSLLIYLGLSLVWWGVLPTNAYRPFGNK